MDYNIFNVYYGVVSILKNLKKLKNNDTAGVATYVLIMFGLIFILYLFGFSSMWISYQDASLGDEAITNTAEDFGVRMLDGLVKNLLDPDNFAFVAGSAFAVLGVLVIGKLTGTLATILQFALPLILLLAMNIFIFPINGIVNEIGFMDATGATITLGLFAFFNIFFILAVIEFIRGNI